ncbi:type I secretion C-terminal target domain-containing protein [Mesorhizobium tamadayense]|uniref:Type I secretion C-terminal target domain-containing protein n=1 Tax=Mesorhizobium tamadayense TaxID=425306 RepID=A0A3P3FWT4_9HYPH|nr:DUF5801 repeats-in-toxin domain-containing protein [Mesorhizobium tamadayense]RRI03071.1 type I secretion C-terminal target domain-containing protein [Mesorhizobium tamadayense]
MTTSIEFDTVSNSWHEHASVGEHPISGVQVAQASGGQAAPAAGEPVPVDVGSGAPAQGAANAQNAQGADKPAADANAPASNAPAAPAANAAASNVPHEYHADAGNVVKLPANVSIDNIKVDGHNLVLVQPDGSEIVIKDGALNVPTFIIGDVEVPRVALIAALEASHVDVAFGADGSISAGGNASPSAGGNFEHPAGGIGDGFGLTSLLPPTALQFGQPENRELFPSIIDRQVSVVATSLLTPDEAASETGLDGGPSQSPGSDAPSDAETSSIGAITIDAPDGIGSIVINGDTVTGVGQQIQGQFGYITIVSFDPITGAIEYNYTVTESVTHPEQTNGFDPNDTVPDNFSVTVTDSDGDTASATFAVAIIDDVPTAVADTDSIAAGQFGPATGNVLVGGTDGADANTTDGVADTKGADGATVVGVAAGDTNVDVDNAATLGVQIQGTYGKLTLAADGTYSYVRDAGTPGGVNDVFTYTIKDGDGDTSHTTLTISIGNSTPVITDLTPEANGGDVVVNEDDLLASRGAGESDGSDISKESTAQGGTFTISSPDGIASLNIGGHDFITNGTFTAGSITTPLGNTLTVTGYNAATGEVSYTYTLVDNEAHAAVQGTNSLFENFDVTLTDLDGQSANSTLSVKIVDDVPTATTEDPQNIAEGATITGTLDFVAGADGATVTHIDGTLLVFGQDGYSQAIDIGDGSIKVKADGSYSFTAENPVIGTGAASATYTVTDGDGDTSTAGISFVVTDANHPTTGSASAAVDDDGLAGGNTASTTGDIAVPNTDGDNNETTFSGTLGGSVGGDGAGANGFSFATLNGTSGTVGQENVTYNWNAGTNTLTATGPRGDLFTVHVTDPATGAYTVTLLDNVLQAQGPNNENNATVDLGYVITDADGSTAPGTLTVTFNDDAPTASTEASQNVAEGGTITGTLDFVAGADGATVTHVDGTLLVFGQDGYSQTVDIGDGLIKVKADGSYSFTADAPVVGTGAASATYTVTDGDGDTATAGISFVVTDANTPTSGTASAAVDDDGLAGGNPTSTTGDIDANAGEVPLSASEAIFNGTLGGSLGGDGAGANGFSFATLDGTNGTVGQENVTYSWDSGTNTLTATGPRGDLFSVHVTNPATGAYTVTLLDNVLQAQGPNNENNATVNLGYLITDADGSTAPGTLTITFNDDAPTASVGTVADGGLTLVTQDAQTIGGASDTASASFAAAFLAAVTPSYGADGAGTTVISGYTLTVADAASGLTSQGEAITLTKVGNDIVGSTASHGEIFRIAVDASGTVTLTQSQQIDHLPEDVDATNDNFHIDLAAGKVTLSATATVTDGDHDTATSTVSADLGGNIGFDDDVPSLTVGTVADGGLTLVTQDAQTIGGASDTASASFAAAFLAAVTPSYGADGAGTTVISGYTLTVADATSGLTSQGEAITLTKVGNDIVGSTASHGEIFRIAVDASGTVTLTQSQQIDHLPEDVDATNDNFHIDLAAGKVTLSATATVTDGDHDTATSTVSTDLGGNIGFDDDVPSLTVTAAPATKVALDETATSSGVATIDTGAIVKGNDPDVSGSGYISTATSAGALVTVNALFGADGAAASGSTVYVLTVTNANSGLTLTDGSAISLQLVNGAVVGVVSGGTFNGQAAFAISINATTGAVTVEQYLSLDHPAEATAGNGFNSYDETLTLANGSLGVTVTVKDGDNDTATSNTADVSSQITFDDDGPTVLDKTDLYFANSGTVSGTGVFDYSIGADGHTTYSSLNSDFAAITLAGTVAGSAITAPTVTWTSETSTTAVFNVSFSYLTGGVSTQETGTLTFDKVAGTYTVDLADPISAVTISTVSNSSSIVGYVPGSSTVDNTQPDVAVAQVNPNLFIQFTGYAEPGSGTGPDNLQSGSLDGNSLTYVNGELLTQSSSYVSISGTANGVAGDTMGKGEVMDMDFFTTNPTGFTGLTPDAQVSSMFLKFDGIGNSEDFIVILKLYDTVAGTYTTKAMYVENSDIFKGAGTGPGIYSGVTLDNNDGLLIIESNDYNAAGQHYVLVGAQITPTDEGITGTAINLNGAIGAGGASTTFQNLSSDSNDLGFKISDIGLVSTTTTAQNADLTFNVIVKDADGDTSPAQQLDVHVVNGVTYTGTADAETMQGTANDDTLNGNGGNDILQGFAGADTLDGGAGNDILIGGLGLNHMTGGTGNDTFVIDPSKLTVHVADVIADYTPGQDVIDLSDLLKSLGGNAPTTDAQVGDSVNVTVSGGAAHVMVDDNGTAAGGNMVEVASLTGVGVGSAITILYDHNQPTHTETV